MQCKKKSIVGTRNYDRILFCRNNSVITSFSFVSKQGVSSKNGSSLASLCFNELGLRPGKSGERYIKSSILKAFYPLKAPTRKLVPSSMEKECALVRRVQSCSSDIIIAKKAQRDNEIREKHIFLIAILLRNYNSPLCKRSHYTLHSHAKCYEEFSNYMLENCFLQYISFDAALTRLKYVQSATTNVILCCIANNIIMIIIYLEIDYLLLRYGI